MFAMLHGAWPRITADGLNLADLEAAVADGREPASALDAAVEWLVADVVAAQVEAGTGVVTDGQVRWADPAATALQAVAAKATGADGPFTAAWKAAAALAPGAIVAQALPGPYTLGRRVLREALAKAQAAGETAPDEATQLADRNQVTLVLADALAEEIGALVTAGCPMVLVEEPDAVAIGEDNNERALFVGAGQRLLAQAGEAHTMLVITGGNADAAGASTVFGAPYESLLVDLITGPDNWSLVRGAPGDRGIVCGGLNLLEDEDPADQSPQLMWAVHYAASSNGRGFDRVGLANAQSAGSRSPERARQALAQLATAVRLASMSPVDAVAAGLNPNAFADARTMPALANRVARRKQAKAADGPTARDRGSSRSPRGSSG